MEESIDQLLNELSPSVAERERKMERLPSLPLLYREETRVSNIITVMHFDGSLFYINLDNVPVIQRTVDETYTLMWPETTNGTYLKPLYTFSQTTDPVIYEKIRIYLASKV